MAGLLEGVEGGLNAIFSLNKVLRLKQKNVTEETVYYHR